MVSYCLPFHRPRAPSGSKGSTLSFEAAFCRTCRRGSDTSRMEPQLGQTTFTALANARNCIALPQFGQFIAVAFGTVPGRVNFGMAGGFVAIYDQPSNRRRFLKRSSSNETNSPVNTSGGSSLKSIVANLPECDRRSIKVQTS